MSAESRPIAPNDFVDLVTPDMMPWEIQVALGYKTEEELAQTGKACYEQPVMHREPTIVMQPTPKGFRDIVPERFILEALGLQAGQCHR
jgi:hypothetical protein